MQCEHVKPDDQRCRARPLPGSTFCYFHDPAKAGERQRARKQGGRARSKKAACLGPGAPDEPLRTPADVSAFLARATNQVIRGELDPKIGNCAGYLVGLLLKSLEVGDLEERLAALEQALSQQQGKRGGSAA